MIVLVGFMGAGKSSVGRKLAGRLELAFVDTDSVVEERAGATIRDIFETAGEDGFRALEHECIAEVLGGESAVVALGGGALGDPATRAALATGTVVFLRTSLEECLRRIGDDGVRPLLTGGDPRALFAERAPVYEAAADHVVDTDDHAIDEVVATIAALLDPDHGADEPGGRPSSRNGRDAGVEERRIAVPVNDRPYEVVVGAGILERVAELSGDLGDAEAAAVVSHPSLHDYAERVAASYEARGLTVVTPTVSEGESSKTPQTVSELHDELAGAGLHRHDLVVGVGGGVVTDIAGFAASTYLRGVAVVHVPTTLLGQVDAAIGGKTGVDLAAGKNLVGTFWQPLAVACDVGTLATLDEAELRAGLAEVVKYGFIARPELLEAIEKSLPEVVARDPAALAEIVAASVEIKARIVAADERELGERAHLNYGHTFAHAIEHALGYDNIRHGEAVALGMMAAAHLARILGRIDDSVVDEHRRVLAAAGLPTTSSELDFASLERAWLRDKKYRRGVRFVLLSGIGKPEAGIEVPHDALEKAVKELRQ